MFSRVDHIVAANNDSAILVQRVLDSMATEGIAVAVYWQFAQQTFIAGQFERGAREVLMAAVSQEAQTASSSPQTIITHPLVAFGSHRGVIGFMLSNTSVLQGAVFADRCALLGVLLAWTELFCLHKQHKHEAINAMLGVIDTLDSYTLNHSKNVANYALLLAEELKCSPREIETIYYGAMFHDIGKVGIPISILCKEGELLPEEYELIKNHPVKGVSILQHFSSLKEIIPIVRHHHERFDGKGYPAGLGGEQIPFAARLVSIVDAYDAITTNRSYRNAQVKKEALTIIQQNTPAQFDPALVAAFMKVAKNL